MRGPLFVVPFLIARAAWPQGNPVGPEFRVNTSFNDRQRAPDVASDPSGAFVVVWASTHYGTFGVYGQRYDSSGAPLGTEFLVSSYTPSPGAVFDIAPAVASDPAGNFVVVWESEGEDGSFLGIRGQRYAGSGAPLGPQFQANTTTTFNQYQPDVAADGSGGFVVVWEHNQGNGSGGIFGRRFASSGAPAGPDFLVSAGTASFQRHPAVAADAAGGFVAVWANTSVVISGRRFASTGAPLGGEFTISVPGVQGAPSVASDPLGGFVVAWENHYLDGSYAGIFGRRYASSGVPLGSEFRVNTYTTAGQGNPSVAADADGNFVVAWSGFGSGADTSGGVFGQRYAASGTPRGSEFEVNTFTTGFQFSPSVAADFAGNFVVVWTSDEQDGDDFGIFGQRYSEIVPVELLQLGVE